MERRVLLAISLSFVVLFVYQALFVPPPAAAGQYRAGNSRGSRDAGAPLAGAGRPATSRRLPILACCHRSRRSSATPQEREIVGRDAEGPRGLHQSRRPAAALDPQGLQERRGTADRSGSRVDSCRICRCRSRCASTIAATTARLNDALYRVTGAEGDR